MDWPSLVAWIAAGHGGTEEGGQLMAWIVVIGGLLILALVLWQVVYRLRGRHEEIESYRVVEAPGDGLAIVPEADVGPGQRQVEPGPEGLEGLIEEAGHRNDVRILEIETDQGDQVSVDVYERDEHGRPLELHLEDSRGLVDLTRQGRVVAQPPLDEAVVGDLEELLEAADERSASTTDQAAQGTRS